MSLVYLPRHFAETNRNVLRDACRTIGAGELITLGSQGLEASLIPLLVSDDFATVTGHLAAANGQWRRADNSVPALVTWVGPHAYVSPSYYPSKLEDGKVVPTWNYIMVQARGALTVHQEADWKLAHVESLTHFHEAHMDQPWSVQDAPSVFIHRLLDAIVGIEVRVSSLEGKWKLSQNRSALDMAGIISGLASHGTGPAVTLSQVMSTTLS